MPSVAMEYVSENDRLRLAAHTARPGAFTTAARGAIVSACVIAARTFRGTSYDALGPWAGAAIAVLGGRCARRLHA